MLVVLSSATGAERLKKALASDKKIRSEIIQTPKEFSKGGCSYSLRFADRYQSEVKEYVTKLHLSVKGFYSEKFDV